jgi:hypothetical protein
MSDLRARFLRDTQLRRAAGDFLRAAHAIGVRAALLKGIVASVELYDDPLDRPFGDVDVLVSFSDLAKLEALGHQLGWSVVHDSRQLGNVNLALPPGLPIDLRATIGAPGWTALDATLALDRAELVDDPRVTDAPYFRLDSHHQVLQLFVDAVMDKLFVRRETKAQDLPRAVRRWVRSPESFAVDVKEARLLGVASFALRWMELDLGDREAARLREALGPLPLHLEALSSRVHDAMVRDPASVAARLGVRLLADSLPRAALALGLGAAGTALYHARNRGARPWQGKLWRGDS